MMFQKKNYKTNKLLLKLDQKSPKTIISKIDEKDVNIQLNLKSTIRYFIIKNRFNNSGIDVLGQVEFTSNTQHCAKPAAAFSLVLSRGSNVSDAM